MRLELSLSLFGEGLARAILASVIGIFVALMICADSYFLIRARRQRKEDTEIPPRDLIDREDVLLAGMLCLIMVYVSVTAVIFMRVEGWSFRDAELWSMASITTLGFASVVVATDLGKGLLLFLNTGGIILLGLILTLTSSKLVTSIRNFLLRGIREMRKRAADLKRRRAVRKAKRIRAAIEKELDEEKGDMFDLFRSGSSSSVATWHASAEVSKTVAAAVKLASSGNVSRKGKERVQQPDDELPSNMVRSNSESALSVLPLKVAGQETVPHHKRVEFPPMPNTSTAQSQQLNPKTITSKQSRNKIPEVPASLQGIFSPPPSITLTSPLSRPVTPSGAARNGGDGGIGSSRSSVATVQDYDFGLPVTSANTVDSTIEAAMNLGFTVEEIDENEVGRETEAENTMDAQVARELLKEFERMKAKRQAKTLKFAAEPGTQNGPDSWNVFRILSRTMVEDNDNNADGIEMDGIQAEDEEGFTTDNETEITKKQVRNAESLPGFATALSMVSESSLLRNEENQIPRKKWLSVTRPLAKIQEFLESHADTLAVVAAVFCVLFGGAGMLVLVESPQWSYLDAVYFMFSLVTTTGYSDIYPQTGIGRTMVMVLMFFGLVARLQATKIGEAADKIREKRLRARVETTKARQFEEYFNQFGTQMTTGASPFIATVEDTHPDAVDGWDDVTRKPHIEHSVTLYNNEHWGDIFVFQHSVLPKVIIPALVITVWSTLVCVFYLVPKVAFLK
ncbi:hypothetical protein HDU83_001869 [Entophlyctis luteolus]|nr:hypothetical protein HDU83_001869 [Entophlyctis luteolus]